MTLHFRSDSYVYINHTHTLLREREMPSLTTNYSSCFSKHLSVMQSGSPAGFLWNCCLGHLHCLGLCVCACVCACMQCSGLCCLNTQGKLWVLSVSCMELPFLPTVSLALSTHHLWAIAHGWQQHSLAYITFRRTQTPIYCPVTVTHQGFVESALCTSTRLLFLPPENKYFGPTFILGHVV